MKSLADALPPEIAQKIHPDWRKNEADYWLIRDELLAPHQGEWVAFADGAVIASASTPLEIFLNVEGSRRHPFIIRVGHEDEPWYHIRHSTFVYDTTYRPTALPVLSAEFRTSSGAVGLLMDHLIPDTGADTTTLPWPDCQRLSLDPTLGVPGVILHAVSNKTLTR